MTVPPTALLGRWRLARRVRERSGAGGRGRVDGELVLTERDGVVHWSESGVLVWDGRAVEVTRELLITPDPWTVRFDDGREFHPWTPGERIVHPCRADTYRGLVDVDPTLTRLRTLWDVHGPAKDQRLVTRCRRLGPA
jgi:hypothetical protein